jgi:hypothetical protein
MEAVKPGEDATTMTDSNGSTERDFFRIDDEVRLNWTRVDPDTMRTDTDRETELMELNLYLHDLISTAFGDSAVVGEALGLLNRKIELLTNNEDSPLLNLQAVPVNLSGSGMAFATAEALNPEESIEITMLLQPANTIVRVQAQIISTTTYPDADWDYWVRAKYNPRQEMVTEQIVQHVNLKQLQSLAARNEDPE